MPKGHIVFDCDGTLISSAGMIFSTVAQGLSEFMQKPVSVQEVKRNFDPHIQTMYANFGITDENDVNQIMRRWVEIANSGQHKFELFPGINGLLKKLEQADYALYVWTARDLRSTKEILGELGILKYFWGLRSGTCGAVKPNPQGLEELVGHLSRDHIFHIGDSYTDLSGAKTFGCRSIAALWCLDADKEALMGHNPDFCAEKPEEIWDIIENYFSNSN